MEYGTIEWMEWMARRLRFFDYNQEVIQSILIDPSLNERNTHNPISESDPRTRERRGV